MWPFTSTRRLDREAELIATADRHATRADRAEKRITELEAVKAGLVQRLAAAKQAPPALTVTAVALRAQLRRERDQSRALAIRLTEMQAANDAMCRDAVTAAGTLAPIEVADA